MKVIKKIMVHRGKKKGKKTYIPEPAKSRDSFKTEAAKDLYDKIIFEDDLLALFGLRHCDLMRMRYFRELPHICITQTCRLYLYDGVMKWLENNQIKLGEGIMNKEEK